MSQSVLQRPTLVLNRNWQPIHVATVARAVIMLYTGTVRVVDPKDYQTYNWDDWSRLRPHAEEHCIHSVSYQLRVPEVVVLAHYDGMPGTTVPFSRRNIYKRDRYTCQYCGRQPAIEDLTIDHVIPRAQGGVSSWENCVLACFECNKHKADHTPGAGSDASALARRNVRRGARCTRGTRSRSRVGLGSWAKPTGT